MKTDKICQRDGSALAHHKRRFIGFRPDSVYPNLFGYKQDNQNVASLHFGYRDADERKAEALCNSSGIFEKGRLRSVTSAISGGGVPTKGGSHEVDRG
ncbi:MAG: hypothetical protein AB1393_10020 [Candidatus Edwardsbacteria bacterium]